MKRSRILYQVDIKDHKCKSGEDVKLGIYGVFDTGLVKWEYYLISFFDRINNIILTEELCTCSEYLNPISGKRSCKVTNSVEDGIKFLIDYKLKWKNGSNDPRDKIRDEKITEILDQNEKIDRN